MNFVIENIYLLATTKGAIILLSFVAIGIFFIGFLEHEKEKGKREELDERKKNLKLSEMTSFTTGSQYDIDHANYIQECIAEATKKHFLSNMDAMLRVQLPKKTAYDIEVAIVMYIERYNEIAKIKSAEAVCQRLHYIDGVENGLRIFPRSVLATDEERNAQLILQEALDAVLKSKKQKRIHVIS